MNNLLTFKVEIQGLENKIWRKIKIVDRFTLADLAYTILASFDSLAYHLYDIQYKNQTYLSMESDFYDSQILTTQIKLSNLNLNPNDTLEMTYDFGSPTTFIITYLSKKQVDITNQYLYPLVSDGAGHGMLDDMMSDKLKDIVEDIDQKGYSNHSYTPGYEREKKYDYRKYDINQDNDKLKGKILLIKNGYEVNNE